MTKYLVEVSDELWKAFRLVVEMQGLKIKDAMPEALSEYIQNHAVSEINIDLKVVENNKKNLLTIIYEEEIKTLLGSIVEANKRNAPPNYTNQLKNQLLAIVKKHPVISNELADEIVTVLKTVNV
jgi:hypothetical protein